MKRLDIERGILIGTVGISIYSANSSRLTSAKEVQPTTTHTHILVDDPLADYPDYIKEAAQIPPILKATRQLIEDQNNSGAIIIPKTVGLSSRAEISPTLEAKAVLSRTTITDSIISESSEVDGQYVVHWNNFDFGHNLETVKAHEELIVKYSQERQLPPDVIAGIIFVESNGYANGDEKTGVGLMGIMPKEAGFPNRPTKKELLDDEVNISTGTAILKEILFNDDPHAGGQMDMFRAVALYNSGNVGNLYLPTHGWYYIRTVFYSIGMKEDFDNYIERNNIQLEE